jgi:translation initiation factor 2 subunit 2
MQTEKDYENMLDRAYLKVKKIEVSERFEVPKVDSFIEGSKTVVSNLQQTVSFLRRDLEHFIKFLSKELATQILIKGDKAIFNRKLSSGQINEKIQTYVDEFVICPECKKPDTELLKEKGFVFLHCLACGAKHSVRAKI